MKVDARVQVASDVSISDESFARAALQLTDAIAKGDADKLTKLISPRAAAVLGELKSTDQWAPATKSLEAVRIITIGTPTSGPSPSTALAALSSEDRQTLEQYANALTRGLPPEEQIRQKAMIQRSFRERAQALAAQGQTEEASRVEAAALAVANIESLVAASAVSFNPDAQQAMLLAIQDPTGAYLWGWQASKIGDTWQFDLAPARAATRSRAALFDGLGMSGFSATDLPAAASAARGPTAPPASAPAAPSPGGSGGG